MDKKLLSILHCPITHQGLSLARAQTLQAVNAAIEAGKIRNREGQSLDEPLQQALVTDDGKVLYPVSDDIPVLLEGASVNMDQLS